MAPVVAPPAAPIRKKLVRRTAPDRSQTLRRAVQLAFFALNAWVGIEFYLFVRYYETGGHSVWAGRPPGVEGWLPIASLMNLKVLLASGQMPRLHPAGMFLLIAFLAASWIFRKSIWGGWDARGSDATSACRASWTWGCAVSSICCSHCSCTPWARCRWRRFAPSWKARTA